MKVGDRIVVATYEWDNYAESAFGNPGTIIEAPEDDSDSQFYVCEMDGFKERCAFLASEIELEAFQEMVNEK